MMKTTTIQNVITKNGLADELYVEIDGEIRELCNITIIDGKLVLRPDTKL